jgi:hypothetical protein
MFQMRTRRRPLKTHREKKACRQSKKPRLQRVFIKLRGTSNVRFGPLCGLKSDILGGPKSANRRHCHFQLPGERLAMMLTTLNVITTSPA